MSDATAKEWAGSGRSCRHGIDLLLHCEDCLLDARVAALRERSTSGCLNVVSSSAARSYPLPRLVRVEWRRRDRMQHAVGFLVADTATHLVLSDRFDGKHPDSRRLWTIDLGDVVVREEVCGVAAEAHECRCWAGEEPHG